jgi:ribonuclease P protein component
MRPQGYPARLRLKQRRDFLRVQQGGRKLHVEHFLVFVAPRVASTPNMGDADTPAATPESLPTRLGITVTRKIGCAVVRNRIKRLVREVFRRNRERLPSGLDLVFVAKQQAAALEYADVVADFELLIQRALRRGSGRGGRA